MLPGRPAGPACPLAESKTRFLLSPARWEIAAIAARLGLMALMCWFPCQPRNMPKLGRLCSLRATTRRTRKGASPSRRPSLLHLQRRYRWEPRNFKRLGGAIRQPADLSARPEVGPRPPAYRSRRTEPDDNVRFQAARFILAGRPLPPITDALKISEVFRRALMARIRADTFRALRLLRNGGAAARSPAQSRILSSGRS
jgi:hypothetical protein